MKLQPIEGSETSTIISQTSGNYPKENVVYSVNGQNLQSRQVSYLKIVKTCPRLDHNKNEDSGKNWMCRR